jgi:hypothetical protein
VIYVCNEDLASAIGGRDSFSVCLNMFCPAFLVSFQKQNI